MFGRAPKLCFETHRIRFSGLRRAKSKRREERTVRSIIRIAIGDATMNIIRQWAIMSVVTGLGAVISYTLMVILSGPYIALVIVASAFGPLLAAASLGLYH